MTTQKTMRAHEKWAVAVAAAAVISPLLTLAISSSAGSQPWTQSWWWLMLSGLSYRALVHLAVGVWLLWTARRDGNSGIVWLALGLVFSLLAAVLYFLLRSLEQLEAGASGGTPKIAAETAE